MDIKNKIKSIATKTGHITKEAVKKGGSYTKEAIKQNWDEHKANRADERDFKMQLRSEEKYAMREGIKDRVLGQAYEKGLHQKSRSERASQSFDTLTAIGANIGNNMMVERENERRMNAQYPSPFTQDSREGMYKNQVFNYMVESSLPPPSGSLGNYLYGEPQQQPRRKRRGGRTITVNIQAPTQQKVGGRRKRRR